MNAARRLVRQLAEPTLVRRGMLTVLLGFLLVFVVLLGYTYWKNTRILASDPGLLRFGNAIALSLRPFGTDVEAAAALASTDTWQNIRRADDGRFSGRIVYELLDGNGRRVYASPSLAAEPLASPPRQLAQMRVLGTTHRVYEGHVDGAGGRRWTLRVAEPLRTDTAWISWNSRVLVENLLIALPCVLLPLWLSVRSGLRPLKQLADRIAAREAGDLSPVGMRVRYRELKPLTGALDDLLARLRQKIEHERAFVQDAAHELRTPLAVVAAQAHVMAHAGEDERAQAHALLQGAIDRASHLAQQLLVLASLDNAQRTPPRRIDVAQAVRQLLAQAAPGAMARGIELSLDAPDRLESVVDEPALESIVHNLVDNAVRYGRDGGSVAVTLRGDEERLSLQVRDDGPGIGAADRERVFERFWRGAGHDLPGSGLGLAIVQQAAARMGGTVRLGDGLESRGVGFWVSLPVQGFVPR